MTTRARLIGAYERLQEAVGLVRDAALCRRLARLALTFEDPGGRAVETFAARDFDAPASTRMLDMAERLAREARAWLGRAHVDEATAALIARRAAELEALARELRPRVETIEAIGRTERGEA